MIDTERVACLQGNVSDQIPADDHKGFTCDNARQIGCILVGQCLMEDVLEAGPLTSELAGNGAQRSCCVAPTAVVRNASDLNRDKLIVWPTLRSIQISWEALSTQSEQLLNCLIWFVESLC